MTERLSSLGAGSGLAATPGPTAATSSFTCSAKRSVPVTTSPTGDMSRRLRLSSMPSDSALPITRRPLPPETRTTFRTVSLAGYTHATAPS